MAASFAPTTLLRYKGYWRVFKRFADVYEPGWKFPVPPQVIAKFAVWLGLRGFKPNTVATHIVGLGWWHKVRGLEDPSKHYLVKRVLIGMRKGGPPTKQAKPLRYPILRKVVSVLGSARDDYDRKLFRAAFLVAYYASLRIGEFSVSGSG